ncbi:DUF3551 domain-containing protein [Bradyrhizobium sp. HKCCYLS2038]|uniref:DUF3551 domain-containing protein n=1 Tax=unclassified Bradyrhizobium TaxID=2631580 RepID=UPI003EBC17C3
MRTILAVLTALASGAALTAGAASPAVAGPITPVSYDYPWCIYGGQLGFSGDCSYQTREQCLASQSGRWNLYCDINRRLRFEPQQDVPQQRHRRHRQEY